jgi:hypothetical protein
MMEQILWVRWLEITVEHELAAREAYDRIVNGDNDSLPDELRDSLVAIIAAACRSRVRHFPAAEVRL